MYKKILCADDLTKRSHQVLVTALDVARRYGAELVVLNVREDFMDKDEMVMLRVDVSDFENDMRRKAIAIRKQIMDDLQNCEGADVKCEIMLREGKPEKIVPEVAREINADLLVIGTHGVSLLRGMLFDSTAEEIVTHAGRSVLAVWTDKKE
jgi:nucleotide-binding universal stress UspA family protein